MSTESLLIEIGTEELPPTSAKKLCDAFIQSVSAQLQDAEFSIGELSPFVTVLNKEPFKW